MNTCAVTGCDNEVHIKKVQLCKTHYFRNHKYGTTDPITRPPKPCEYCGEEFQPRPVGLPGKYCSGECRTRAAHARRAAAAADARAQAGKVCPQCGEPFTPSVTIRQMYCSKACGANANRDASGKTCQEADCDRPMRARGMCSMHWKQWGRREGIITPEPWDDRRRDNYHRRRARMNGAPSGDPVMLTALIARDNSTCHICRQPVDMALKYPDPMSRSIDHIIPISRGGLHEESNCGLAHLRCNVSKSARLMEELEVK